MQKVNAFFRDLAIVLNNEKGGINKKEEETDRNIKRMQQTVHLNLRAGSFAKMFYSTKSTFTKSPFPDYINKPSFPFSEGTENVLDTSAKAGQTSGALCFAELSEVWRFRSRIKEPIDHHRRDTADVQPGLRGKRNEAPRPRPRAGEGTGEFLDPRQSFMSLGRAGLQCSGVFMVVSTADPGEQEFQLCREVFFGDKGCGDLEIRREEQGLRFRMTNEQTFCLMVSKRRHPKTRNTELTEELKVITEEEGRIEPPSNTKKHTTVSSEAVVSSAHSFRQPPSKKRSNFFSRKMLMAGSGERERRTLSDCLIALTPQPWLNISPIGHRLWWSINSLKRALVGRRATLTHRPQSRTLGQARSLTPECRLMRRLGHEEDSYLTQSAFFFASITASQKEETAPQFRNSRSAP
ncbi:unnamed protein product [Spodoptera exigua]|nr:unnamed protein product [Spodoptera exigua]